MQAVRGVLQSRGHQTAVREPKHYEEVVGKETTADRAAVTAGKAKRPGLRQAVRVAASLAEPRNCRDHAEAGHPR